MKRGEHRRGCQGVVLEWDSPYWHSERGVPKSLRVPLTEREDAELCLCVWVLPTDRPFWEDILLNSSRDQLVVLGANNTVEGPVAATTEPAERKPGLILPCAQQTGPFCTVRYSKGLY